jgi:hypothetical protein
METISSYRIYMTPRPPADPGFIAGSAASPRLARATGRSAFFRHGLQT